MTPRNPIAPTPVAPRPFPMTRTLARAALVLGSAAVLCVPGFALPTPAAASARVPAGAAVAPEVEAALARSGGAPVRVIVMMGNEGNEVMASRGLAATPAAMRAAAAAREEAIQPVVSALAGTGDLHTVRRHWLLPAMSAEATLPAVHRLAAEPVVRAILLDERQQLLSPAETGQDPLDMLLDAGAGTGPVQPAAVIPWGVSAIRAPDCWNSLRVNGNGVVIAHLDTGVDYNHPDLVTRIWRNPAEIAGNGVDDDANGYIDDVRGWDFSLDNANPMDDSGHGTHTAGTVVGTGALGTATGIAPGATLMPLKVLANGYGYESDAWAAIEYAVDEGADIITMSLGWIQCYHRPNRTAWRSLCQAVEAQGVLIVAAAGNEGADMGMPWYCAPPSNVRTPGDVPTVLTVGATNTTGGVPSFSSVGPVTWSSVPSYGDYPMPAGLRKPDLAAPGYGIISTLPGSRYSTATWSGTSMACPHVAGAAALMLSANPSLSPATIRQKLMQTAIDVSVTGPDNWSGTGRIDAYAAVQQAAGSTGTEVSDLPVTPDVSTPAAPVLTGLAIAPNPVRDDAEIRFDLGDAALVTLEIFDAAGRRVVTLEHGPVAAGPHATRWNGRDANGAALPSGVYWARFTSATVSRIEKLILAR